VRDRYGRSAEFGLTPRSGPAPLRPNQPFKATISDLVSRHSQPRSADPGEPTASREPNCAFCSGWLRTPRRRTSPSASASHPPRRELISRACTSRRESIGRRTLSDCSSRLHPSIQCHSEGGLASALSDSRDHPLEGNRVVGLGHVIAGSRTSVSMQMLLDV
jgi:hypothetical protein